MQPFATEFPIKAQLDRPGFVAQVISWLRGTEYSTVLNGSSQTDLESRGGNIISPTGEELRFREISSDGKLVAIGCRHDYPDIDGRLWRTEVVLVKEINHKEINIIRLKTQCIAKRPGAVLEIPRKPYLIKLFLKDSLGGYDGIFQVTDKPIFLKEDENDLSAAVMIFNGTATTSLPVIYVSATGPTKWALHLSEIEKLAYSLGGIAHVVAEPNREFSFKIKTECAGQNVYGGTIGMSIPGRKSARSFYVGWQLPTKSNMISSIQSAAANWRSQMPTNGWDWADLQEEALKEQRIKDKEKLTFDQTEELYQEEIKNLQERISELQSVISSRMPIEYGYQNTEIIPKEIMDSIGPEIYKGEFSDRIVYAIISTLDKSEVIGLDERSKFFLQKFSKIVGYSHGIREFRSELKKITTRGNYKPGRIEAFLCQHGYHLKYDHGHPRLEPVETFKGIKSITISKTPSDHRAPDNTKSQIEQALGLATLG